MLRTLSLTCCFLMTLVLFAPGCHRAATETANTADTLTSDPGEVIPFVLTDANNISIQVLLNDEHKVDMMFHTGVTSVSLTSKTVEEIGLNLDQTETVKSWGGDSSTNYGKGHSIRIGGMEWNDLTITEGALSGPNTGGKFGYNFFDNKIVQFDFEACELKVRATLPDMEGYEKFDIEFDRSSMFITGSLKIGSLELENKFLIHSGYGGAVLLDDEFVANNQLADKLETVGESELKDSYGNVLKTKKVVLPEFRMGSVTMENIPMSFFEGAMGKQRMSVIGGDVLKRFHIVLDLQNSHLYLKPNQIFGSSFKA